MGTQSAGSPDGKPPTVVDDRPGPRRSGLEAFPALCSCLRISGLWAAPGTHWVWRRVYRWAAPLVLTGYIVVDEVGNYHGPEDDNAPTAPNHYAILFRLVLFLTSHLLGSLYLYSGHLDALVRTAGLSDPEADAIDRKVSRLLVGGLTAVSALLCYSVAYDFVFHQTLANSQIVTAWLLASIRMFYGYYSLVFMQAVHWLLVCLLTREVDLVTHSLFHGHAAAEGGGPAPGVLLPDADHRTDEETAHRVPEPVLTLRDAIQLHKALRAFLKTHSSPIQWWLASYLALVAGWTFTLYFVSHELRMPAWRKLLTYAPIWCMNMYYFIVPVLFTSTVHSRCTALVDALNDWTPTEGPFADRHALELFVSYARRAPGGFCIFGVVVTRNPTYVAAVFGVCEGMFM